MSPRRASLKPDTIRTLRFDLRLERTAIKINSEKLIYRICIYDFYMSVMSVSTVWIRMGGLPAPYWDEPYAARA